MNNKPRTIYNFRNLHKKSSRIVNIFSPVFFTSSTTSIVFLIIYKYIDWSSTSENKLVWTSRNQRIYSIELKLSGNIFDWAEVIGEYIRLSSSYRGIYSIELKLSGNIIDWAQVIGNIFDWAQSIGEYIRLISSYRGIRLNSSYRGNISNWSSIYQIIYGTYIWV